MNYHLLTTCINMFEFSDISVKKGTCISWTRKVRTCVWVYPILPMGNLVLFKKFIPNLNLCGSCISFFM